MKKLILGVVLALLGVTQFSYATNAVGSSEAEDTVILAQIQVGANNDASNEYVALYNNSSKQVDITGWCLTNKSNAKFACFGSTSAQIVINPHAYIAAKSKDQTQEFANSIYFNDTTKSYITASTDTISLLDPSGAVIDTHAWTTGVQYSMQRDWSATPDVFSTDWKTISGGLPKYGYVDPLIECGKGQLVENASECPPDSTMLRVVEVLSNPKNCLPSELGPQCYKYVKLQNTGASPVDMSAFRLRYGSAADSPTAASTLNLTGTLQPSAYAIEQWNVATTGSNLWIEDVKGTVAYADTELQYPSGSSHEGQAWSLDSAGVWRWTSYPTPLDGPNQFTDGQPINTCEGLRLQEIGANLDRQFIELYNSTSTPIDIGGCRVQTNRSETAHYAFPSKIVQPGEVVTIYISDTDLTLTKTTSGTVFVLSSDGQTEVDSREYDSLSAGASYALIDGKWSQTYAVTPGAANVSEEYQACEEGYVRGATTGRCNKVVALGNLTPCVEGQYRSEETNRCRSIVSALASLAACGPGQERNPTTNRCRKITSSTNELQPCKEGQERNPATNRCRNSSGSSVPVADFPVKPTENGKADSVLGWLAAGGVGILAAGYGAWEWRREIQKGIMRIVGIFKRA